MKGIKKIYYIALIILAIMTLYAALSGKSETDKTGQTRGSTAALSESAADFAEQDTASEDGISAWQYYENEEAGFRLDFPGDWTVKENKDEGGNIIVTFVSPETTAAVNKEIEAMGQNYGQAEWDVEISYSATVAQEAENVAGGYGATTLEELIRKNSLITKIGERELNGVKATEAIIGGEGDSYGVYMEKDGRLYKILFNHADKGSLSEQDKKLLETFEVK